MVASKLVGLKAGEEFLITSDSASDWAVVEATALSARRIGAKPSIIVMPQLPIYGKLADALIPETVKAATKACDAWMDYTNPTLGQSTTWQEAMDADRVRYFMYSGMKIESFERLFGGINFKLIDEFQNKMADLIRRAKHVRIKTRAGTDLSFENEPQRPVFPCGFSSIKGLNFPPASVVWSPKEESLDGQINLESVLHTYYSGILRDPITVKFKGQIQSIEGGATDGAMLERFLKKVCHGRYGGLAHLAFGAHPTALFKGMTFAEDMRGIGANAVGLGYQWEYLEGAEKEGGGDVHPDGTIQRMSVWLDGVPLLDEGTVVGPREIIPYYQNVLKPAYEN